MQIIDVSSLEISQATFFYTHSIYLFNDYFDMFYWFFEIVKD